MTKKNLTGWNAVLERCGCCLMPVVPVPLMKSENRATTDISGTTEAEILANLESYASAMGWPDWPDSTTHPASEIELANRDLICVGKSGDPPVCVYWFGYELQVRYAWVIPDEYTGSWFRIEWQEVFQELTEEGDDAADPVETDRHWEWSGDDKTGPWSAPVIVPSGKRGTTTLKNIRWKGYRSKLGETYQDHEG